jgi:hypothetical protein
MAASIQERVHTALRYIFDYGDDLRHTIEFLGNFPLPAQGDFPRIIEVHGEAPPQYPSYDEEGTDDEDWKEEEEEKEDDGKGEERR